MASSYCSNSSGNLKILAFHRQASSKLDHRSYTSFSSISNIQSKQEDSMTCSHLRYPQTIYSLQYIHLMYMYIIIHMVDYDIIQGRLRLNIPNTIGQRHIFQIIRKENQLEH